MNKWGSETELTPLCNKFINRFEVSTLSFKTKKLMEILPYLHKMFELTIDQIFQLPVHQWQAKVGFRSVILVNFVRRIINAL